MVTSYGRDTSDGMTYCNCLTNTTLNCNECKDISCDDVFGVVCQAWDNLQPTNNASECTVQPPMTEPTSSSSTASSVTDYTSPDSTTTTLVTEHATSTQPTRTSPDNHTVLFGAIIGVLFALLLATLVGWMCTCIIMHKNNTTKSSR